MSPQVLHAKTLVEAIDLAGSPYTRLVAGGTALQLEWAKGVARPKTMVTLERIGGLDRIEPVGGAVRIGALARLSAMERHAAVATAVPMLAAAIRSVAGPAVRNLATLGGNIASGTGCLLPTLLALDATVEVATAAGHDAMLLADWLKRDTATPSVLVAIRIPSMPSGCRWTQRKTGLRTAFTPSVISVAGILDIAEGVVIAARLAAGGGIVTPQRLSTAEAALTGTALANVDWDGLHARLLDEIVAPDDAFRTGRYRRIVAANALVAGLSGSLPGRVTTPKRYPLRASASPASTLLSKATRAKDWHIRPDGPPKIDGTFAYLTDKRAPDMLVGRTLRAGIPHARILSIDTSAAEALPGVLAVVTHRDVPGDNAFGIIFQDQPAFCFDRIRYAGDAVAAVAAVDAHTAEAALALIRVEYEPLPVIDDPEAALAPDATPIHAAGNLMARIEHRRGDPDAAFTAAAHVVEATYTLPRQMHGFMETEGGHAEVADDGTLIVSVGGQHGGRDRLQLSRILKRPEDTIRVVTSPTGGAFGGKDELTVQPALALLALKSGRPVRLQLDRTESVVAGIKRHPMVIRMRTACDADGMLIAQDVDILADGGAYASLGPAVLETALEHAAGPYVVANLHALGRIAYTNNGVCGAFRGFGANQIAFATECQMDRLAALAGLDPFDIRRRNLRQPGSSGPVGQKVTPSERLFEMLDAAATDPLWRKPSGAHVHANEIIGIGMALAYQGNGLGTLPDDPAGGRLRLAADGKIEALYGLDEIGQGLITAIRASVSKTLGCAREDIRVVFGDTALAPESGSTTDSRGSYVVWKVADLLGPELVSGILAKAAAHLGLPADGLTVVPGGIAGKGSNSGALLLTFADLAASLPTDDLPDVETRFDFPKTQHPTGNARFIFCFGATLARVAVSRVTGMVRVLDLVQHTAAGPVMDIAAYLGQIEGGGVQGLGFTLTEDCAMQDGQYVTTNLDSYMLPGIADAPDHLRVHALESLDPGDPFGPRGVGELGIAAITPAIANAVADALGAWPERVPVDPEWVLDRMAGA